MKKPFYNQGDLLQYRDSKGDLEVGVITRVFKVEDCERAQLAQRIDHDYRYAVTWTNHNGWGSVGISETYNEEFFASDIDENDYVTLLTRAR